MPTRWLESRQGIFSTVRAIFKLTGKENIKYEKSVEQFVFVDITTIHPYHYAINMPVKEVYE